MGRTEIQVLDLYQNRSYPDGMAGSVYGVNTPMANALRPPGEFNSCDIIFRRLIFKDGELFDEGRFTVLCNGVLVQDSTPLEGGGGHKDRSKPKEYPMLDRGRGRCRSEKREARSEKRAIEGGTDGRLTEEAAMAKRAGIATEVREHADSLRGDDVAEFYRTMESLVYVSNDGALERATELADAHAAGLREFRRKVLRR